MKRSLLHVALVVRDYDEAIEFYTERLDFRLVEDVYQPEQDKRWVVVAPPGSDGATLLLARASTPEQERRIGDQAGGRVFLFLQTDDFWRDYNLLVSRGVTFVREPRNESYGTVAVFEDLYGNRWDLLQPASVDAGLGERGSDAAGEDRDRALDDSPEETVAPGCRSRVSGRGLQDPRARPKPAHRRAWPRRPRGVGRQDGAVHRRRPQDEAPGGLSHTCLRYDLRTA